MLLVDAPERAHQAQRQLRSAHFHREHQHRQAFLHRHVLGDVEREGGLAHRRPGRQHDQVALLQPGGHAVQVVEAGTHAGHLFGAVVGQLLHAVDQGHHQLVDALEALALARAFFADLEDLALGLVEHLRHRPALRVEGAGGDVVAGGDQLAQDRALAHDLGVTPHVGRTRHALRQRVEVGQAATVLRLAQALQLLEDGDHVGRLAADTSAPIAA